MIERRSSADHAALHLRSEAERYSDIAKYYFHFTLARLRGDSEGVIRRKRQITLPLVTKNRQFYWHDSDQPTIHTEIEHHAMPYYVLKRVLGSIPRQELDGCTVLDLFSGHGAVGNALAMGGLQGDVKPKQIIMVDHAYTGARNSYAIRPKEESLWWKLGYVLFSHWHHMGYVDGGDGWIFRTNPDYSAGDGATLPFSDNSIDTLMADPPFGVLTRAADPETLLRKSLHEVKRILRPGSNAYYLMPRAWTDQVMENSPIRGTILARNIGRTWFDISLVKFTK